MLKAKMKKKKKETPKINRPNCKVNRITENFFKRPTQLEVSIIKQVTATVDPHPNRGMRITGLKRTRTTNKFRGRHKALKVINLFLYFLVFTVIVVKTAPYQAWKRSHGGKAGIGKHRFLPN